MKRFIFSVIILATSLFCSVNTYADDRDNVLKIYNWADYIDESLLDEFCTWYKEQTGETVKIIYQLFDINEIMLSKIEKGHEDFDVVCPSEYIIERMLSADLLLPIDRDFGNTPNYIDSISPYMISVFDKINGNGKNANDYSVGYMWGTLGIMYNPKYITRNEASSWTILQDPKIKGKLFMKDAFRDVYTALLIALNKDKIQSGEIDIDEITFDSSDKSIEQVENFLMKAKDNISGWETDFGKEMMTKEKGWLNLTWSGDASWAIDEAASVGVKLDYAVPGEGSIVWFDGWVIPKYAKNVKAARYFINFMCKPENAIRNMNEIGYVSAVGGSTVLSSRIDTEKFEPNDYSYFFGEDAKSVCIDPIQYPSSSTIKQCGMMHDSGERTDALISMWSRVKGDNASYLTYLLIGAFAIAFIVFVLFKKSKKHRRHHN